MAVGASRCMRFGRGARLPTQRGTRWPVLLRRTTATRTVRAHPPPWLWKKVISRATTVVAGAMADGGWQLSCEAPAWVDVAADERHFSPPPNAASFAAVLKNGNRVCPDFQIGACLDACPRQQLHVCAVKLKGG